MTILITLTLAGIDTGPFDLYSDADNYTVAFDTNVSRQDLLDGYTSNNAPAGTTTVRLDSTNQTCGSVDIYSCATPNCDFTGEILCDVTTTTTSTSSSSTTTTTTTSSGPGPITSLCLWSTLNEGTSGELGVYNIDTNVVTTVLVPNDFLVTQGVTRPMCSTQNKLWLASETDLTQNNFIIREYDVTFTSGNVGLSFTRDITVSTQGILTYPGYSRVGSECTALTAINDTSIIIVFGGPTATVTSPDVWGFTIDISQTGNIAKNLNSTIGRTVKPVINTYGKVVSNPRLLYLNNGDVITSVRMDGEADSPYNGNYLQQYNIPNNDRITGTMKLQDLGIPEFTVNYTSEKYIDIFSINSKLYALQPELNRVYEISQTPDYQQQSSNLVGTNVKSLSTTSGCADITLYAEPECESTTIPNMYDQAGDVYIGPVPFTYAGMTVMASSTLAAGSNGIVDNQVGTRYKLCAYTGLVIAYDFIVQGSVFEITLTFAQPVNNIPITAAVLNTVLTEEGEFSSGDIYQVDTNTETPTLSISTGNGVKVIGNQFGGMDYNNNDSNGEFIVTCETNYTILTLSGQAPTGGPVGLGCLGVEKNCTWAFPARGSAGIDTVFIYNPINNTYLPQSLSNGFGFVTDYKRSHCSSENTLFYTSIDTATNIISIKRYDISQGLTYIDEVVTPTPPAGEAWVGTNLCAIDDNTLLLNSYKPSNVNYSGKIYKLVINIDGTTTITFLFPLNQRTSYWRGPLFSNNKIMYAYEDTEVSPSQYKLAQREYPSGPIELQINISSLQVAGTSPDGYFITNSSNLLFVFEDKMYLLVSGITLYEIDTTFPYNVTLINDNTAFFGEGVSNNSHLRAFSNSGECSSNLSFIPTNETTTTSTTITTTTVYVPAGVKTIWTTFSAYTSPI